VGANKSLREQPEGTFKSLTVDLLIFSQGIALEGRRSEFIQSLKKGFCRFRHFDAFMTQKQVSVTDFLLVILMVCTFIRGNNGAFQGNTRE